MLLEHGCCCCGCCCGGCCCCPLLLLLLLALPLPPPAVAVRPAAACSELLDQGWELKSPWFQRDVPLSFDVLLENMTDPAHVPQSHHGIVVSLRLPYVMVI
jgi:hypothetical protein